MNVSDSAGKSATAQELATLKHNGFVLVPGTDCAWEDGTGPGTVRVVRMSDELVNDYLVPRWFASYNTNGKTAATFTAHYLGDILEELGF